MLKHIAIVLNINVILGCCCCKNNKTKSGELNIEKTHYKSKIKYKCLNYDDLVKRLDNKSIKYNKNIQTLKEQYNKYIKDLDTVKELLENTLNYNYQNNEPHFPHIHWNGNVKNSFKYLCFMIAPLNVILHLDKIKEFFKSDPEPKNNSLTDSAEIYNYIQYKYFIHVYKMYIERLGSGYSFTIDPQKDEYENPIYLKTLCIEGKADKTTSSEVSEMFFNSINNNFINEFKFLYFDFDNSNSGCHDIFAEKDDNNLNVNYEEEIINKFKDSNKESETNYDVIYLNYKTAITRCYCEKTFGNQLIINNICENFNYNGNKYHLDGLVYLGTNDNNKESEKNDVFSFVYDKNAPDKNKPYVFCQLDCKMKYYSLQEIQNIMKPNNKTVSPYKYKHFIASAFSKIS